LILKVDTEVRGWKLEVGRDTEKVTPHPGVLEKRLQAIETIDAPYAESEVTD